MQVRTIRTPKGRVVAVVEETPQIAEVSQAMDLMATLSHEYEALAAVVPREVFAPAFYELRTRLAGEILQKYTNYHFRLGIVGDFAGETSKALRDFIYECNRGRQICFLPEEGQALDWLVSRLDA